MVPILLRVLDEDPKKRPSFGELKKEFESIDTREENYLRKLERKEDKIKKLQEKVNKYKNLYTNLKEKHPDAGELPNDQEDIKGNDKDEIKEPEISVPKTEESEVEDLLKIAKKSFSKKIYKLIKKVNDQLVECSCIEINISNNPILDIGAKVIAAGIKSAKNLSHLDLSYCRIKTEGMKALGDSLESHPNLKSLILGSTVTGIVSGGGLSEEEYKLKIDKLAKELNYTPEQVDAYISQMKNYFPNDCNLDLYKKIVNNFSIEIEKKQKFEERKGKHGRGFGHGHQRGGHHGWHKGRPDWPRHGGPPGFGRPRHGGPPSDFEGPRPGGPEGFGGPWHGGPPYFGGPRPGGPEGFGGPRYGGPPFQNYPGQPYDFQYGQSCIIPSVPILKTEASEGYKAQNPVNTSSQENSPQSAQIPTNVYDQNQMNSNNPNTPCSRNYYDGNSDQVLRKSKTCENNDLNELEEDIKEQKQKAVLPKNTMACEKNKLQDGEEDVKKSVTPIINPESVIEKTSDKPKLNLEIQSGIINLNLEETQEIGRAHV